MARLICRPLVVLVGTAIAVGCSSSDSLTSAATDGGRTTTVAVTSAPDSSTTSTSTSTTSTTTTSTTTTAPTITTTVTTTTTAPAPTTSVPPGSTPVPAPSTAFMVADTDLLEIDVASGEALRTIVEFFSGEGVFRFGMDPTADRTAIWFSEAYEDSWFGCQTSIGSVGRLDPASGAVEIVDVGSGPSLSPNEELVAYLSSGLCLPDPDNPEFWVLTPYDRVVVRRIESGEIREFVTADVPDAYGHPGSVDWAGFSPGGNLLVLTADGVLRNVDVNGSTTIQDHPVVLSEVTGFPVAATADALLTIDFGDEGSSDLYSVDAGSGAPTLLASTEGFMAVAVSEGGHIAAASFDTVTVAPGADVTVLVAPGDAFVDDIAW